MGIIIRRNNLEVLGESTRWRKYRWKSSWNPYCEWDILIMYSLNSDVKCHGVKSEVDFLSLSWSPELSHRYIIRLCVISPLAISKFSTKKKKVKHNGWVTFFLGCFIWTRMEIIRRTRTMPDETPMTVPWVFVIWWKSPLDRFSGGGSR